MTPLCFFPYLSNANAIMAIFDDMAIWPLAILAIIVDFMGFMGFMDSLANKLQLRSKEKLYKSVWAKLRPF